MLGEYFLLIHPKKSADLAQGKGRGSRLRPQVFVELLAVDIKGAAHLRHRLIISAEKAQVLTEVLHRLG